MNMTDQEYPHVTVGGLVINPKGEVLLVKSHKWRGKYVLPGGHVELGERMQDAVVREIFEETGLKVKDVEWICLQEFIFDEAFWKRRHFIFSDFLAKATSTNVTLNDEAEDYAWVSLDNLGSYPIAEYTLHTISEYLKKNKKKNR